MWRVVERIKAVLRRDAKLPVRAHPWDAGIDLYATDDGVVTWFNKIETYTAVEIPQGYVGFVKTRSSYLARGLMVDGTIDSGYTGTIKVMMFNFNEQPFRYKAGDKIAQLVIVPCVTAPVVLVDELEGSDRGEKGFGSTGR